MPTYSTSTPSATIRQETEPNASDYLFWIKASTNQTYYSDGTNWTQVVIEQDLTPLTLNPFSFEKNYNVISKTTLTNQALNIEELEAEKQYYLIYKHTTATNNVLNIRINGVTTNSYKQTGLRYYDNLTSGTSDAFNGFIGGSNGTTSILSFKKYGTGLSMSCINMTGYSNLNVLSFGCGTCGAGTGTQDYILNIVGNSTGEVILLTEI